MIRCRYSTNGDCEESRRGGQDAEDDTRQGAKDAKNDKRKGARIAKGAEVFGCFQ